MSADVIDAYYSVNSPYAFMGAPTLRRLRDDLSAPVRLRFINAADVFGPSGTLPVHQRPPARQAYRLIELARWAKRFDVPLTLKPAHFPALERPAHGALLAADDAGLDALTLAEAVARAIWVEEKNPGDPEVLTAVLAAAGAPDAAALVAAGADPSFDARLAANAEAALAAGAFGFPWYVYKGEPFWGQDRLDFLEDAVRAA